MNANSEQNDGIFNRMLENLKLNKSLTDIIQSDKTDGEKLALLTKFVGDTFKDCEEQQKELMQTINNTYKTFRANVIVGGEPEISNTEGDAGTGGESK